jgi:hypothetical protein
VGIGEETCMLKFVLVQEKKKKAWIFIVIFGRFLILVSYKGREGG